MEKTRPGNYFEDFTVGQELVHATPRTVTEGDVAVYRRSSVRASPSVRRHLRRPMGLPRRPGRRLLVFHVVFGKTVPDVSLNAIANLGYARVASARWSTRGTPCRRPPG
jgi:2-methylfumaryl-CoA hydratase